MTDDDKDIAATRRRSLLKLWMQGKRLKEDEKSELKAAGMLPEDSTSEISLGICESQRSLAARLAQHFAGQLRIDISEQQLGRWKKGEGLPAGARLPPPKINNRLDAQAWADWVTEIILPKYGAGKVGKKSRDVFEKAAVARAQREIYESERARIIFEDTERTHDLKWILKEDARATSMEAMSRILHYIETEYERNLPQLRRDQLKQLGLGTEVVNPFFAWDNEQERERMDRIREMCNQNK